MGQFTWVQRWPAGKRLAQTAVKAAPANDAVVDHFHFI